MKNPDKLRVVRDVARFYNCIVVDPLAIQSPRGRKELKDINVAFSSAKKRINLSTRVKKTWREEKLKIWKLVEKSKFLNIDSFTKSMEKDVKIVEFEAHKAEGEVLEELRKCHDPLSREILKELEEIHRKTTPQ